jgi:catalase
VYVADGLDLNELAEDTDVSEFLTDAYKHCKVIGADGKASGLISAMPFASKISNEDSGMVMSGEKGTDNFAQEFIAAMGKHRIWERETSLYN